MTFLDEDPALSRDDLADRTGADPDALSHAFKRELGVGLVVYRNRLRLRRFFELASTGRLTMLAACLDAGFGSYPQFHRVFVAEAEFAATLPGTTVRSPELDGGRNEGRRHIDPRRRSGSPDGPDRPSQR